MLNRLEKGPFMCVSCGYPNNQSLVKVYGKDAQENKDPFKDECNPLNIKLTDCEKCFKPVDDYWQLDNCILIINAILLKSSFFRHIIHNCNIKLTLPIKLYLVYCFCDAFKEWSRWTRDANDLFYVKAESMFYQLFLHSLIFNAVLYLILYLLLRLTVESLNLYRFITSLVICSYSKLYKIPITLWPSECQNLIDFLLELNLIFSLVQCCVVFCHHKQSHLKIGSRILLAIIITTFLSHIVS